ncbi:LuxR C-terminal-related transcriptional regulator, partial [Acinetobacter baumannii]
HSPFFPKETEVAKIFAQGYVASEVAQKLGKSLHTVTSQLRNMTKRLKLRSSREIIKIVHKLNL